VGAIESSDVSLYAGVLGAVVADTPLEDLGVKLDGELVELPDKPKVDQAAWLLWLQLALRLDTRPDVPYWENLKKNVRDDQDRLLGQIGTHVRKLQDRLEGIRYESLDMFEHAARVADDPHTVVVAAPPTYNAGFERFYSTKGRLTWDEPPYRIFDPKTGCADYMDQLRDAKALLLMYQEANKGQACARPVFARPGIPGMECYLVSNRTDEILAITGGPKVDPRYTAPLEPASVPMLPPDHEITPRSSIAVAPVKAATAEYYRRLWMHRLAETSGGGNAMLFVDGYVAGVFAYSSVVMTHPYPGTKGDKLLLRYALGPTHDVLRLTRLVMMVALQQQTARTVFSAGTVQVYAEAASGVVTANYTPHPEAKQNRGLMKLESRKPHHDGYHLIYSAEWRKPAPLPKVLGEFLTKEAQWRKSRTKAS
jgi:hypothetical protein